MKIKQFIRQLQRIVEQQDGNDFEMPDLWDGDKNFISIPRQEDYVLKLQTDFFGIPCINVWARTEEYIERAKKEQEQTKTLDEIMKREWQKRTQKMKDYIKQNKYNPSVNAKEDEKRKKKLLSYFKKEFKKVKKERFLKSSSKKNAG